MPGGKEQGGGEQGEGAVLGVGKMPLRLGNRAKRAGASALKQEEGPTLSTIARQRF